MASRLCVCNKNEWGIFIISRARFCLSELSPKTHWLEKLFSYSLFHFSFQHSISISSGGSKFVFFVCLLSQLIVSRIFCYICTLSFFRRPANPAGPLFLAYRLMIVRVLYFNYLNINILKPCINKKKISCVRVRAPFSIKSKPCARYIYPRRERVAKKDYYNVYNTHTNTLLRYFNV